MKTSEAWALVGGLSKPSKMPGWSIGIPAKECKTGSKLRKVKGSTCYDCYALKGCYVFKVVQDAQYKRLEAIKNPLWVAAMTILINSKKSKWFRWHDSGDVQDLNHLNKIFDICRLTPGTHHWLPTQERQYLLAVAPDEVPSNLVIRLSGSKVDGPQPSCWPHTSTVVTKGASCPAPSQGGKCKECRNCWNKNISNISYGKH